jgi:hypothetical protein
MRRAALERQRTLRVWRQHLAGHSDADLCHCEFHPGRFRKGQRIGGCGTPRCWLCHAGKLMGDATLQERRAMDAERDGFFDYRVTGVTR